MPPQPTPAPTLEARQYVTVSSAMIVTASVDPDASYLPVDGQANTSPQSTSYGTVSFEGVGGTLTVDEITTTSTSTDTAAPTDTDAATVTNSTSGSQSISVGAVVAVAVVAGILSVLLIVFFWWRRRKTKRENESQRTRHQEMSKTYVGGHGFGNETPEGPWEKFNQPASTILHVPGNLPSPTSSKLFVAERSDSQRHLLNQPSVSTSSPTYHTASSRRAPPSPRRHSVKSTVTGKVNPSNNFADDEDYDDDYGSDAKSHRSRANPLSPPGGMVAFQGLNALGPPPKLEPGAHNSFLTFRSGEYPPMPTPAGSNIRESPTPVQTPKPKRVPTTKSHKGGAQSQHGHAGYFDQHHLPLPNDESAYGGADLDRRNTKDMAMDNLLAALDTPTMPAHPQRAAESPSYEYSDGYDRDMSPVDPTAHIIPSPSSPRASPNPLKRR